MRAQDGRRGEGMQVVWAWGALALVAGRYARLYSRRRAKP